MSISLVLVPVLTVLILLVIVTFVVSRKSTQTERAKLQSDDWLQDIQQRDQQAHLDFVGAVVNGTVPLDQAISRFETTRAELLPNVNLKTPFAWGPDDLKREHEERSVRNVEAAGRSLLLPATGAAATVIAIAIVVMAVLYSFRKPAYQSGAPATSPPTSALPVPPEFFAPTPANTATTPNPNPANTGETDPSDPDVPDSSSPEMTTPPPADEQPPTEPPAAEDTI